ncbi:MAG TPA: SMP-30/gluconolactonase/LRE family protein [Edaphobacter sp.]|nr:SMP-30/gluconolactonase/LRE family protein [Edaphobacter sp.]
MNNPSLLLITLTSIFMNLGAGTLALSAQAPTQSISAESLALQTSINAPRGIACDQSGFLYVSEVVGSKIIRLDILHGTITTMSTPPKYGGVGNENLIATDKTGSLFITDTRGEISKLDSSTGKLASLHTNDSDETIFSSIAIDNSGGILGTRGNQLLRWTPEGTHVVAGVERKGLVGDGGPAVEAAFNGLMGVAVNSDGDIFLADSQNCRIRKIDSKTQYISTIAGIGECRSTGDNGPANNANLSYPNALTCDREGNIFFVEDSFRVRRIDRHGIISTYAGTGQRGFSGDGGVATHAQLDGPSGLAADESGNLHIADYVANRIRRVDVVTQVITTVAGDGSPKRIDVVL